MSHMALLAGQAVVVIAMLLALFRVRRRLSLCPLYVALGVMQPIQVQLAATLYFEISAGLVTSTGSAVLFTGSLFVLLLIYIREDAAEARKVVYALVLSNLVVSCLYVLIGTQIGLDGIHNPLGLPVQLFHVEGRVMAIGTLLLFADALLVILVYEAMGRLLRRPLFVRLWLSVSLVLVFDSVLFTFTAFPAGVALTPILLGGIVARCGTGLLFAAALHAYLRWLEPAQEHEPAPLRDVFEVLTYREKFHREQVTTSRLRIEHEARLDAIMKAAPDGLLVCRGNRVLEMNAAAAAIFGRTATADDPVDGWVVPAGSMQRIRTEAERHSHVEAPRSYTVRAARPDGREVPVEIVAAATRLEGDDVFVMMVRDISARLTIERHLREAERMNAIGSLAAGVAHDFNNILTAISGAAELAELENGQQENLQVIRQAVAGAAALTRQLLTISRQGEIQRRPVDLRQVVEELRPLLARIVREDVDLDFAAGDGPVTVHAAPAEIQQVLMNLVVNALQALDGAGRIRVTVACRDVHEPLVTRLATLPRGRYGVIEVDDTGRGIDAETAMHVFEPFFTTKGDHTGSGLGLASVRRIVDTLQGGILLAAEPGRGATFTILLPAVDVTVVAPPAKEMHGPVAPEHAERVLVCEDDPGIARVMSQMLRNAGFDVQVTTSPMEALAWIQANGERLDVLVTDMVMPEMSGRGLASAARRLFPSLRVVYVTGYLDDPTTIAGLQAAAVVTKPFLGQDLVAAIHAARGKPDMTPKP